MRRYTAHHQFQYPHGLELLRGLISSHSSRMHSFNALMGLSCYANTQKYTKQSEEFQCPLGLIPHFYFADFVFPEISTQCVNALSGLYLISTVPLQKPRFYAVFRACFCRHLSEYSDNSYFSCMLTFWTYLMRCTYP